MKIPKTIKLPRKLKKGQKRANVGKKGVLPNYKGSTPLC